VSEAPVKAVTTGQWWVQVKGHSYGPYSKDELSTFIVEGRVRPSTPVSDQKDGAWVEARRVIGLIPQQHGHGANDAAAPAANVFVHAEIFSGSWNAFMAALEGMGVVCDLGSGFWLLRTPYSVGVIRNTLSQTLERGDRFVVIDATRDRLAWFNLGPEVDVNITRVWNAPLQAASA
jgi:GYF domain 2